MSGGHIIAGRDFTDAQAKELHAEAKRRGVNIRTVILELFPDPKAPIPAGPLLPGAGKEDSHVSQ